MSRRIVEPVEHPAWAVVAGQRVLDLFHAAQRGADHDGDAVLRGAETRAGAQVRGGADEQRGRARAHAGRDRRQLLDLAAAADAKIVGAKTLDGRERVAAAEEAGPERVQIEAERRDHAGGEDGDGLRMQEHRSRRRRS